MYLVTSVLKSWRVNTWEEVLDIVEGTETWFHGEFSQRPYVRFERGVLHYYLVTAE